MAERSILVVAVDGLRAAALGAYGNTAFGTPALDQLAAESFLFDSCLAPAAELPPIYRALWESKHSLRMDDAVTGTGGESGTPVSLPTLLGERGYETTLVTDAAEVAVLRAASFAECVQLSGDAGTRAEDVSETALARLVTDACDVVASPNGAPQLVWVHARGMYGPWDAPLEMQESLLDEGDPPPVEDVAPPNLAIEAADGPDTAFRYGVAYAAQVMVLDACWEALRDAVASNGGEWLVVLMGVRGFPLGEHQRVGGVDGRLFADQLHVPWLMRYPDGTGRLGRCGRLVSPLDLLPTLAEWTDSASGTELARCDGRSVLPLVRSAKSSWRDSLLSSNGATGELAIRTPDWSLRFADGADSGELFVRPDDRWEANDVAGLCPDVVEELITTAKDAAARIRGGEDIS
ncbi:MAG: sulfatase-like hydrolase/transferase [Pirellulales bacterium]